MAQKDWDQVKEIFNVALRQKTDERPVFLDAVCKDDIDLRIEVESLLIAFEEGKSFLEQPIVGETSKKPEWRLNHGQVISHFKIISPIAAGGMGEVYSAEDRKLHRKVALKVLPQHLSEDRARMRRFQREAQAVSALNHPNILTIFEFDEQDSMHIIASEFVEGETLRERIRRGSPPVSECVEIGIQIASALQAAHAAGVIHRDIKPENIMIRNDGLVKVLDFGLAKLTAQASNGAKDTQTHFFSHPGVIMGTAAYMSPEQARAVLIDARTDIYSFGVVMYEMITGSTPFSGDTTADMLVAMIQADTPRARTVVPGVPGDLDAIIAKAMEKDRSDRFDSVTEMLAALERLRKDIASDDRFLPRERETAEAEKETEILAAQPATGNQVAATSIARKFPYAVATGILLVIALIVVGYLYFGRGDANGQIDSIAVMPFENKSGNADIEYLSDGMTESLINSLSRLPNLSVKARNTVFRYKGGEIDEKKVGKELSVQALLFGRLTQRGDNITIYLSLVDVQSGTVIWGENYDRRVQDLTILQNEITRDVSQKLRTRLSNADAKALTKNYTENAEAYQLYLKGRYFWAKRTPEAIRRSIDYFNQAIEIDSNFARAYSGLADAYVVPASRIAPQEAMPKAKAAAIRALEIDENLAEARISLARVLQVYDWNWKEAEKEFKRAIELDPRYPVAHQWYGGWLERMGRHDEGIAERKLALELDPLSVITNFELGQAYLFARDYDRAIEQLNKTLELDPDFPAAVQYVPLVYAQKGMYDKAISKIEERPETGLADITGTPGYVYAMARRTREAREILAELKRLREKEYITPIAIAFVYIGLGEKDEAIAWLEKGYEERAFQMQSLNVDPRWDSLRSDPRFVEIVRRVGLPSV